MDDERLHLLKGHACENASIRRPNDLDLALALVDLHPLGCHV